MPDFGNRLDIICLEYEAFYALVEEVVGRLKEKHSIQHEKWIGDEEAMHLQHITSKTTLQKYRDEGLIRFTQPSRKIILYDRDSILGFLNTKAKDFFSPFDKTPVNQLRTKGVPGIAYFVQYEQIRQSQGHPLYFGLGGCGTKFLEKFENINPLGRQFSFWGIFCFHAELNSVLNLD